MGTEDKAGNKAEDLKGKVKESTGKATDDESLEAEGKTDQSKSSLEAGRREREGRLQGLSDLSTCVAPACPIAPWPTGAAQTTPRLDVRRHARRAGFCPLPPAMVGSAHASHRSAQDPSPPWPASCRSRSSACSSARVRSGPRGRRRPAGRCAVVR